MPTKPKDRDEGLEVHLAMARAMYHRRVTKPRLARKTAKAWVGMVCVPTWTIDDYTSGSLREEHDLPVVHVGPASAEHSFTMNGYTFRFIPVGTSVCVDTERIGKHIERSADRLGFSVTPDEEGYSNLTFKEDLIQVSWSNFGPLFPDPKYESPDRTCLIRPDGEPKTGNRFTEVLLAAFPTKAKADRWVKRTRARMIAACKGNSLRLSRSSA